MTTKLSGIMVIAIALIGLLTLMSCDQQTGSPVAEALERAESILGAPGGWHQLSDSQRNQLILAEAEKWVGEQDEQDGNCKEWVRAVVLNASARDVSIPSTYQNENSAYHYAKWYPEWYREPVYPIWRGAYWCPSYFPSKLKPGQIIQLRWRPNVMDGNPHTAIIQSVSSTKMYWYDSNFNKPPDGKVRSHPFTLSQWQQNIEAWTVYQIK